MVNNAKGRITCTNNGKKVQKTFLKNEREIDFIQASFHSGFHSGIEREIDFIE